MCQRAVLQDHPQQHHPASFIPWGAHHASPSLTHKNMACIRTAAVLTACSSATTLPPLCTVVLDCSVRNHLHRRCYHRHHRQSKFIECGQTAHHARLRRSTSYIYNYNTPLSPPARVQGSRPCPLFYLISVSMDSAVRIFINYFFVNFSAEARTWRYLCERCQRDPSAWLVHRRRRWQRRGNHSSTGESRTHEHHRHSHPQSATLQARAQADGHL